MIIEFTGIPGSGKSTILRELQKTLTDKKYIFDIPKYILGFEGNTIVYDLYLTINIFRLSKIDWQVLRQIFHILKNSKNSLFHKVNILRNAYKRLVINNILEKKKEIFFIDEGISHLPLTIFVNINRTLDHKEIIKFINLLDKNNKIFLVDAPDDILLSRVIKRGKEGHRRIDFDNKESIIKFMSQSRDVIELIKNKLDISQYENMSNEIDINEILKKVGIKNV